MRLIYPVRLARTSKKTSTSAAFLHDTYFKYRKPFLKKGHRRLMSISLLPAWRWFWREVIIGSWKLVRQNCSSIDQVARTPFLKQYFEVVGLCLTVPTIPQNYYIFDLFDPQNRERVGDYINRHEVKGALYKMLHDGLKVTKLSPLTDKGKFYRKAKNAGLPIVPTYCTIASGKVNYLEGLPPGDLFIKSLVGRGGRHAQVWRYRAKLNKYRRWGDKRLYSLAALVEKFRETSTEKPVIMQCRIKNHPEIADLGCSAVATCRIITMLNEQDEPEAVVAVFRMAARRGRVVDNIHKGGIAAPVEMESGVMGKATNLGVVAGMGRLSHHPVTGAIIEGYRLPFWNDVLKLALRGHKVFRPRVIIGWDIAITTAGPVIVEGNAQPCVDLIQRPHNRPLGCARYGELMAFHLRRKFGKH